ncbi:MAG: LysR substrate-binding domain-containing protein [Rickettsiales bacterium]|nr:LysR substrate-binding domain-containing protein [Rickettsiales bacterium]
MTIDIITLQSFIAVAETGSFTKAADRVGRTQSAISQQMSKLEHLLGKTLIIRGKHLALTPEGEIYLGYAKQIYALFSESLSRFKEPELEGEVRFGIPEDFASVFLSDVLVDFSNIHPLILLNIECDLTLNLFERFRNKEFDLVLVKMTQPDDFPNGQDVWTEPLEWIGDESLIRDDKPIPLVLSPKPCVYRAAAIQALESQGYSWRLTFSSTSYAGKAAAVKAGMGITVLPRMMAPKDLPLMISSALPKLDDIHVSLLKHENTNQAINSFEKFVLKQLR